MAINAIIRFLQAARNLAKQGMSKEQILDFARREFGEVSKLLRKQIDDIFKTKPKTEKKGDVVPIKKKIPIRKDQIDDIESAIKADEGIVAADAAKEIVKKRTKDIAKGDVTEETSDLMKGIEKKVESIKKQANKLKEVTDKPSFSMIGTSRDPRQGVVRAAAREILNKNKVNIGREDPIDVLRKMYGEKGLEAVDAVSDSLLDVQSYGEMNTILKNNKLFDLVPKKTYGYDESIVTAEKIRKAKEQEAKQRQILEEFDPTDRTKNAHGGLIDILKL
tara:strand:- start:2030 stop:2860 length:831 start_codon:yes stop_codon:yes gene_type:complete